MRLVLAVTNQPSIGAFDCQKLMEKVNAFRATAGEGWEGSGPLQILVTGRSAYVAEISLSMRHDIVVTLFSSIVLVSGGFLHRLPSLAPAHRDGLLASSLLPRRARRRAAHFPRAQHGDDRDVRDPHRTGGRFRDSDFRPLPAGTKRRPHTLRRRSKKPWPNLGRAIFFGALTTAVGFLALLLAGSAGFTQLGVLIAIGILSPAFA